MDEGQDARRAAPAEHDDGEPWVDALSLDQAGARVYEAIATLEYLDRPVTKAEIAAAAAVDDGELEQTLADFVARRVVRRVKADGDGSAFILARRDWSAAPEVPGHGR